MHLDDEATLDFIEGQMPEESKRNWNEHVVSCAKCAQSVSDWKEILDNLTPADLSSAPDETLSSAIRVFPIDANPENLKTMLASIVFDSFAQPAFAGVRGPADARQMLLRTENIDIDLHITQSSGKTFVWGQLLPRASDAMVGRVQVTLLCDGERVQSARTNETGEFRFEDVPDGELSIGVFIPSMSRQVFGVFKIQRN